MRFQAKKQQAKQQQPKNAVARVMRPERDEIAAAPAGVYDIMDVAEQVGTVASMFVDDRMYDDERNLADLPPDGTKTRERAVVLGEAAVQSNLGTGHRETAVPHARATALLDEYQGRAYEIADRFATMQTHSTMGRWITTVPDHTRAKFAKEMSLAAKPGFLLGDSSLIFGLLYTGGTPAPAALLAGLSAATGAVFGGATAGRFAAIASQRDRRGARPTDLPDALGDLYADPERSGRSFRMWLGGAAAYGVVLALGVLAIGLGTGAAPLEALGSAMLTMITVGGSGFAEAYSTNPAADSLDEHERKRDEQIGRINDIVGLRSEGEGLLVTAAYLRTATAHEATAAGEVTSVVAEPVNEQVYGYLSALAPERLSVAPSADVPTAPEVPAAGTRHSGEDILEQLAASAMAGPSLVQPTIGSPALDVDLSEDGRGAGPGAPHAGKAVDPHRNGVTV